MRKFVLLTLGLLFSSGPAFALCNQPGAGNIQLYDGNGAACVSVQGVTGGVPLGTIQSGTTGTDFSANAATIPMSGFSLLATIPATPGRAGVEIQNQSAGTLQVVRDDGAGANQTTILLGPGAGVGTQGGGWSSSTFKGRIRVYGTSGSQVSADQE